MVKRYVIVLIIYILMLLFSVYPKHKSTSIIQYGEPAYWFSIYYEDRFWKVNTEGKIYDVCSANTLEPGPFVAGIDINIENGTIQGNLLPYIPLRIPEGIFEINLKYKYIVTYNSALVYLTELGDIQSCLNTLVLTWQYLDSEKTYLFKNGKIYKIKG